MVTALFVSKRLQCAALAVIVMVAAQLLTGTASPPNPLPPGAVLVHISR